MNQIRKSIAALVFTVGTWGVTAFAEGGVNGVEWAGLLVAIGGTAAVWGVPNDDPDERGAVDPGSCALGLLLGLLIGYLLWKNGI